jgi:YesN/AraC family two-component response regulator
VHLLQVVVIDDEPWALLGIRNAFDWTAYGFGIIAECTDAEEAFEIIRRERPDIVFTDIRMPKYNGIDIMRMTRELELDTEFVVVSGFAEFAYVQEALKFGALDYCLKPVNPEMTGPLLEKAGKHIKKKQSLKDNALMEALTAKNHSGLHRLNPSFFSLAPCCWHAVIRMKDKESSPEQGSVPQSWEKTEIHMNSLKTLYIVRSSSPDLPDLHALELRAEKNRESFGISGRYGDLEDIPGVIREADIAVLKGFVTGRAGVFPYKDEKKALKPFMNKLKEALEQEDFNGISALLDSIGREFAAREWGMNEAVHFWNQAIGILIGNYKEEEQLEGLEYLNYLELCDRFQNLEAMLGFLAEVFRQLGQENGPPAHSNEILHYFNQLVKYIEHHYDQELYIRDLSERFYINQFTCCKLFKKVLGKTFTEYVMEIRLDQACRLMKSTELTIEEIALKVGYSDYFYFNKVFKKHYGLTPARFKRSRPEGE